MAETANAITSTTLYPDFDTKAAFMLELRQAIDTQTKGNRVLLEILYRLSNTDTDDWTAGSTVRHDD